MRRLLLLVLCAAFLAGCSGGDPFLTQIQAGMPGTWHGREVVVEGTVTVNCREVNLGLWDSELVDGDIVTIVVNGETVIENYTLAKAVRILPVRLRRGYNWVLLFAQNEGSIAPNSAAIDIQDCSTAHELALSSDLRSCGAAFVVVQD